MQKLRIIVASSIASIASIVFVTVITIWAELSAPLKGSLQALTGHHWVTKSIGMMIVYAFVFAVAYAADGKIKPESGTKAVRALVAVTIASTLAVFLFFVWHYLTV